MVVNPLSVDGLPFRVPKDGSQAGGSIHTIKPHTPHASRYGRCPDILSMNSGRSSQRMKDSFSVKKGVWVNSDNIWQLVFLFLGFSYTPSYRFFFLLRTFLFDMFYIRRCYF